MQASPRASLKIFPAGLVLRRRQRDIRTRPACRCSVLSSPDIRSLRITSIQNRFSCFHGWRRNSLPRGPEGQTVTGSELKAAAVTVKMCRRQQDESQGNDCLASETGHSSTRFPALLVTAMRPHPAAARRCASAVSADSSQLVTATSLLKARVKLSCQPSLIYSACYAFSSCSKEDTMFKPEGHNSLSP